MSEISIIGNAMVGKVQSTTPPPTVPVEVTAPADGSRTDCVEFSQQAQLLEKLQHLPSVRQDRIDAIKNEIATNSYLSDEKLHVALERMIDEMNT